MDQPDSRIGDIDEPNSGDSKLVKMPRLGAQTNLFARRFIIIGAAAVFAGGGVAYADSALPGSNGASATIGNEQ
ncbi:MAG TPA: hypothetical protein VMV52_06090 [Candidatus Nanopelagicaceae bacterium]|nr:hypothetical protein [Candidatus Nanopelagicaceae bacterium]